MSSMYFILMLSLVSIVQLCFSSSANAATENPKVLIKTSLGDVTVELYQDKAPISVKNFLQYVQEGHYNGTIFHRVIPGFMVQGGGFTKGMQQKSVHAPIKNEATNGLINKRGSLAMARTGVVDSATAQFFVNTVDNKFLNYKNDSEYGYAVFGQVINGMDVIDSIEKVKTTTNGPFQNVPVTAVEIIEAKQL